MNLQGRLPRLLVLASALTLGSCMDARPSSPVMPDAARFATTGGGTLLRCDSAGSASATSLIDVLGGTLRVTDAAGGTHEVVFPAGAVDVPTTFTLSVPASPHVKVRVTALDPSTGRRIGTFRFPNDAQPTVSISLERCTGGQAGTGELVLFHVDEESDAVLEGPFGTRSGNRVSGQVPHFTDYAIGQP